MKRIKPTTMPGPSQGTPAGQTVYDLTEQSLAPGLKSVLLLEDDTDFAEMVCLFLESHGFRVSCVTNGVEGLKQIMAEDFDIVLCDLVMPNLPGDMFYLAVQRTKRHLCKRFVFMTGYREDPKWTKFLATVTGPVMGKPFGLEELLSTIQQILTENALES